MKWVSVKLESGESLTIDDMEVKWFDREGKFVGFVGLHGLRKPEEISLPVKLAKDVLGELYELRGDRDWWKDEPRCNYQNEYKRLCDEIEALERLMNG